jgi:hypothetical protein
MTDLPVTCGWTLRWHSLRSSRYNTREPVSDIDWTNQSPLLWTRDAFRSYYQASVLGLSFLEDDDD